MKAGEPDQVSSGKQGQLPLDQHLQATQHPSVHTFTNETHTASFCSAKTPQAYKCICVNPCNL